MSLIKNTFILCLLVSLIVGIFTCFGELFWLAIFISFWVVLASMVYISSIKDESNL